jgi:hypothetical protein
MEDGGEREEGLLDGREEEEGLLEGEVSLRLPWKVTGCFH